MLTSVSASLSCRIYFGEVQLGGLGEGNCKLSVLKQHLNTTQVYKNPLDYAS